MRGPHNRLCSWYVSLLPTGASLSSVLVSEVVMTGEGWSCYPLADPRPCGMYFGNPFEARRVYIVDALFCASFILLDDLVVPYS